MGRQGCGSAPDRPGPFDREFFDDRLGKIASFALDLAIMRRFGEMDERFKSHAWKACLGSNLTGVRIPVSPPEHQ